MASSSSAPPASSTSLYSVGNILQLRSHNPCQPFGEEWYKPPFDIASMDRNATKPSELTPEDFVFTKQSRDRDPRSPIPPFAQVYFDAGSHGHKISLRVLENKATGRATGSQLVLCEVQTNPSEYWRAMGWEDSRFPSQVIAKIFDPLLYSTTLSHHGKRWDPVSWADKQHAHEAAAYIEIHGHRKEHPIVDDVTPNFYGSFSMTLESPPSDTYPRRVRHVRAVLLEHIHGTPLPELCIRRYYCGFPLGLVPTEKSGDMEERLRVFARMLHGLTALDNIGVSHRDRNPKNILVLGNKGDTKRRVVITDFNKTLLYRYSKRGTSFVQALPRPLHPAFRFGIRSFNQFGGWFPEEWLDFEETYSETDSDSETDSNSETDSKTHSDSSNHPDDQEPGPSFEAWALKMFSEKDFVMEDEADEIAEQYTKKMTEKESTETNELQPV